MTALAWAAFEGHDDIVKLLLNVSDINPNLTDVDGATPLMQACEKAYPKVVELLLAHSGTDAYAMTDKGYSAFLIACEKTTNDTLEVVTRLLVHEYTKPGKRVNHKGRGNMQALYVKWMEGEKTKYDKRAMTAGRSMPQPVLDLLTSFYQDQETTLKQMEWNLGTIHVRVANMLIWPALVRAGILSIKPSIHLPPPQLFKSFPDFYAVVVFPTIARQNRAVRFFTILDKLPFELVTTIICTYYDNPYRIIASKHLVTALRCFFFQ